MTACAPVQALSAAIIAFAGLYLRSRYSIRPDAVYRKALVQLNTNPAILEVQFSMQWHTVSVCSVSHIMWLLKAAHANVLLPFNHSRTARVVTYTLSSQTCLHSTS